MLFHTVGTGNDNDRLQFLQLLIHKISSTILQIILKKVFLNFRNTLGYFCEKWSGSPPPLIWADISSWNNMLITFRIV
jgi:hypothetical protein